MKKKNEMTEALFGKCELLVWLMLEEEKKKKGGGKQGTGQACSSERVPGMRPNSV